MASDLSRGLGNLTVAPATLSRAAEPRTYTTPDTVQNVRRWTDANGQNFLQHGENVYIQKGANWVPVNTTRAAVV